MSTQIPPRTRLSPGQILRRALIGGVVLLVLLSAGARWNLRRQVHAEIDRIRAAGQPVTLQELAARHADLGGRRDASAELTAAIAGMRSSWQHLFTNTFDSQLVADELPLMGQGPKLAVTESIPAGFTNSVALAMIGMTPAFDQLGQVLDEPNAGFRNAIALTNGFETLLPHLSQFKQLAQWHALRTAWQLDRGETDAAVQTTINLLRLSRVLEAEPTLISQLVRLAMVKMGLSSVERLTNHGPLTKEQLQRLRVELALARPDRAMLEGMKGERAIGLSAIHFRPMDPATLTALNGGGMPSVSPVRGLMLLYRMTGLADRDTLIYLAALNAAVAAGTNTVSARLALDKDGTFDPRSKSKLAFLSGMLLPALGKAFQKEADCLTALAAADVALAVEAYRADHSNRLPNSLDDLLPVYSNEAPVDSATGKAMSLNLRPTGYAIHAGGAMFSVAR